MIVSPSRSDNSLGENLRVNVGVNDNIRSVSGQLAMTQVLGGKLGEGQVSKTVDLEVESCLAIVKPKLAILDHLKIFCENIFSHVLFIYNMEEIRGGYLFNFFVISYLDCCTVCRIFQQMLQSFRLELQRKTL